MQTIQLSNLSVSKHFNVRKTDTKKGLDELTSSIAAHGLLENLIVIKTKEKNKFEVVAGGRRLTALHLLQKQGKLPKTHAVNCQIVEEDKAEEISLAENVVRSQMHPADQFEAWAKLSSEMSIADIAARFGVAEITVEQRLKLGRVSPKLMKAYRNEELSLESLMAFTITDDHAKQEDVFKQFKDSWQIRQPNTIRSALTETMVRGDDKLAKFVGLDTYKLAGGAFRTDLFGERDSFYLEDLALLHELAEEKLNRVAVPLKEKWKWVEIRLEFGWEDKQQYGRFHPHQIGEIPKKLLKQQEVLEGKMEEMDAAEDYDDDAADALRKEQEELEAKLAEYSGFTEEERASSGCVITIQHNGTVEILEGMIHPDDKKAAAKSANSTEGASVSNTAKHTMPYSQALVDRLKNYRLQVERPYMAQNFEVAFDATVYMMCLRSLNSAHSYYYGKDWLRVKPENYHFPHLMVSEDKTGTALHSEEEKLFASLPLAWMNIKDEGEKFKAFCELSLEVKQRLFAACVSRSLMPQLSIEDKPSPVAEAVFKRLDIDVAKHWRPSQTNFFDRVTKKDVLEIGEYIFGEAWAKEQGKKPKGDVVTVLHGAFANPDQPQFTPEQQAKLKTWLPKGMA